ncbi:helicase required for RNAi-mediated heterochromatin assembly 1 [Trichoderma asperellum]
MDRSKSVSSLSPEEMISFHVTNAQLVEQESLPKAEEWRSLPEMPLAQELMTSNPSCPPHNPVHRLPESKSSYLSTHYELSRYEAVDPLRGAIHEFRLDPTAKDSQYGFIYTEIRPRGYLLSRQGACCRISFSTQRAPEPIDWRESDRLTPGQLVALSPSSDNFQNICIVATVATRSFKGKAIPSAEAGDDPFTQPQVELFWADPNEAVLDPFVEYMMLEAKVGYFENVRYTMLGLQHTALSNTSLDKYIVGCPKTIQPARQIAGQAQAKPAAADKLDFSQEAACKAMVTGEFSIVQGPPGTGKTFTSTVAIDSFVRTLKACVRRPAPIIIAAQTNHALDQLLEECVRLDLGKVVRLGGQSRSEIIGPLTIYNVRAYSKFRRPDSEGQAAWKQISAAIEELFDMYSRNVVRARDLHDFSLITDEQYQSLLDIAAQQEGEFKETPDNPIFSWLDIGSHTSQKDMEVRTRLDLNQLNLPLLEKYNDMGDWDEDDAFEPRKGRAPDDAKFKLRGLFLPFNPQHSMCQVPQATLSSIHGPWRGRAKEVLDAYPNLSDVPKDDRQRLYFYLKTLFREQVISKIRELLPQYKELCDSLQITRWDTTRHIINREGFHIIGCTTTGLSKYRGLIASLMPQVMLVEEAAEAKESTITAAIFPSLERLILVGDHQQLPPHVDIHGLNEEPFNLHVSMFERLVKLGAPHHTLQMQRRMIPRLCEIVQTFYPTLKNHPDVSHPNKRASVPGMGGKNLWWFQHKWAESRDNQHSYFNSQEANMIVNFCHYLINSGLPAPDITILTYYNAQLDLIQKLISQHTALKHCKDHLGLYTVDGFQGKENEVIIISLVRSPDTSKGQTKANAGFVQDENRAVVATSRAKHGMFIFGNATVSLQQRAAANALAGIPAKRNTMLKIKHTIASNVARGGPSAGTPASRCAAKFANACTSATGPGAGWRALEKLQKAPRRLHRGSIGAPPGSTRPPRLPKPASVKRLQKGVFPAEPRAVKSPADYTSDELLHYGYRRLVMGERVGEAASPGAAVPQTLAQKWAPGVCRKREEEILGKGKEEEEELLIDFGSD